MKHTFFLLALLVAAAAAQSEDLRSEGAHETPWCQEEKRQSIDACRAYLMKQCTASTMPIITWPWKWRRGSCRALKQRCCNQLEQVPQTCRCKAIRSTVREMHMHEGSNQQGAGHGHQKMMSKVKQTAKSLPSVCNLYPSYCNIPTTTDGACYCR